MTRTVGIDPGRKGAIALLHGPELVALVDLPVTKSGIDMTTLARYLAELVGAASETEPPARFVIEEPPFMPGQYGQMTKGRDLGRVEGVVSRWDPLPIIARPPVWKRHHGLIKKPKDAARDVALELWPNAVGLLARKKDVDRADAALIARWHYDISTQPTRRTP